MSQKIPAPLEGNDDRYRAWLNYSSCNQTEKNDTDEKLFRTISGAVRREILRELKTSIREIIGVDASESTDSSSGIVYIEDPDLREEGYAISKIDSRIEIRGNGAGLIYATYDLIRHLQLGTPMNDLSVQSNPYYAIRMLNHWDDPKFDHTLGPYNITRGFAGNSIFNWEDLEADDPRYIDYARLLASTGINATCINNVNADPDLLETRTLPGIAKLAERLRPYGIKLYLSITFSAPMVTDGEIGEEEYGTEYPYCMRNRKVRNGCLETADPRDERVQDWWARKVAEIYDLIPDFGGFVVKANSEGMPGPQEYGLSHADGANLIARALKPHGGTVFWRSFVHSAQGNLDPTNPWSDGSCGPYLEFVPLDGKFDDNVILQTKNGPADFRADEPPSSLFGAIPNTPNAIEFMIAQEYLGHTTHIAYQAHHWHSILNFDTHHRGKGTTIASITSGNHDAYKAGAMVGVANIGDDPNWFGHLFAGANAYAFGRLAWDPSLDPSAIAKEWATRTLGHDDKVISATSDILDQSYSTFARYAAPLGLGYMHEGAHHYEPHHSRLKPREWNESHAGFDRTIKTGSQYLGQYTKAAAANFDDVETCPTGQLLFFHALSWSHTMANGQTLAEYIAEDRIEAVQVITTWLRQWEAVRDKLDPQTWAHVYERMNRQYVHAGKWRDQGLKALEKVGQYEMPSSCIQ